VGAVRAVEYADDDQLGNFAAVRKKPAVRHRRGELGLVVRIQKHEHRVPLLSSAVALRQRHQVARSIPRMFDWIV
jgi:hypothetical protein